MKKKVEIFTKRFFLRTLTPNDVTYAYYSWFQDPEIRKFITVIDYQNLDELREYVKKMYDNEDVLFLGIFTLAGGHIGNIKYLIKGDSQEIAEMGIMIGEPSWRGKGVAVEVLTKTIAWLRSSLGIEKVCLGVRKENLSAVAVYHKVGFVADKTKETAQSHVMTLSTDDVDLVMA